MAYYFATGNPPGRMGSKHPTIALYQTFETEDDYIAVAVSSENTWPPFCRAIDREEFVADSRFRTNTVSPEPRHGHDRYLR